MKKVLFLFLLVCCAGSLSAKKIKFSVDMRFQVVDTAGVHITGDFQDEAGFAGGDWMPNTILMSQELSDTNIYSVVLDIPAFQKWEFKFVNGDQGYQQEFVPLESRVNYNFIDSRWIYLDSLSNDTQEVAPIRFAENSPLGYYLVRFYVDMQNEASVSANGVHVAGNFQGWDPATTRMYSFDGNVYEYIAYVDTTTTSFEYEFKYANGNTSGDYETVPSPCANASANRSVFVTAHVMLPTICYANCVDCASVGVNEIVSNVNAFNLFPNPANETFSIQFSDETNAHQISISDVSGRNVLNVNDYSGKTWNGATASMEKGIYLVTVRDAANEITGVQKLIVQ